MMTTRGTLRRGSGNGVETLQYATTMQCYKPLSASLSTTRILFSAVNTALHAFVHASSAFAPGSSTPPRKLMLPNAGSPANPGRRIEWPLILSLLILRRQRGRCNYPLNTTAPCPACVSAECQQLAEAVEQCHERVAEAPVLEKPRGRDIPAGVELICAFGGKLFDAAERPQGDDFVPAVRGKTPTHVSKTHPTLTARRSMQSATRPHAAFISSHSTLGRPPRRRPLMVPMLPCESALGEGACPIWKASLYTFVLSRCWRSCVLSASWVLAEESW